MCMPAAPGMMPEQRTMQNVMAEMYGVEEGDLDAVMDANDKFKGNPFLLRANEARRTGGDIYEANAKALGKTTNNQAAQANAQQPATPSVQAPKTPTTAKVESEKAQATLSGGAGTMLTGSLGIDPQLLSLGKNTLLGQ